MSINRSSLKPLATVKPGKNLLAVECHDADQTHYIDVGIVQMRHGKP